MVNINPSDASESLNHHTHYLRLKSSKSYVQAFWEGNPDIERAWVPWDWAETVSQQTKNNSFVLFSPSNDTLHGVKADYEHLKTQRTQLYGNLWYKDSHTIGSAEWESLDIRSCANPQNKPQNKPKNSKSLRASLLRLLPESTKTSIKRFIGRDKDIGKRNI